MKQNIVVTTLMAILAISISFFILSFPSAYSQDETGYSAMTFVSFGNGNSSTTTNIQIENKSITYFGTNTTGYLVYPSQNESSQKEKYPAIVMIHENKGLNDYIKKSANLLAKNGYVVLAVDLFNGEVVTDNQARSGKLTSEIRKNPSIAIENMQSAVKYLRSLDNVNPTKIASIGWCFGGGQSLQLAINSKDNPLSATIIYYGVPLTNNTKDLMNINWPVLGIFGGNDKALPVKTIKDFQNTLNNLNIKNEIYIYPKVGHAFANPSNPNYAPQETADAWEKTLSFLNRYLQR